MQRITEDDIWCSYGKVHLSFSDNDQKEEEQRLKLTRKAIEENNHMIFEGGMPVAFFVWKLLDYAAITVTKTPDFLQDIQEKVENFHKDKNAVAGKIREFKQNPQLAQVKPQKTGNSKVHRKRKWTHETFFTRPAAAICWQSQEDLRQQVNASGTTGWTPMLLILLMRRRFL